MNYQMLQGHPEWALAYNYKTKDAYFIKRFDALTMPEDYNLAYPQTRKQKQNDLRKILLDLSNDNIGWPILIGV